MTLWEIRNRAKLDKAQSALEYIINNIELDNDGCWMWKIRTKHCPYGRFNYGGLAENAHRAMFTLLKGEIPDGHCVCHTCDKMGCVNPDHLWSGTIAENNKDMFAKGRNKTPAGNAVQLARLARGYRRSHSGKYVKIPKKELERLRKQYLDPGEKEV